ncbi:unnamed protein product, partial [Urochloa humidicola]
SFLSPSLPPPHIPLSVSVSLSPPGPPSSGRQSPLPPPASSLPPLAEREKQCRRWRGAAGGRVAAAVELLPPSSARPASVRRRRWSSSPEAAQEGRRRSRSSGGGGCKVAAPSLPPLPCCPATSSPRGGSIRRGIVHPLFPPRQRRGSIHGSGQRGVRRPDSIRRRGAWVRVAALFPVRAQAGAAAPALLLLRAGEKAAARSGPAPCARAAEDRAAGAGGAPTSLCSVPFLSPSLAGLGGWDGAHCTGPTPTWCMPFALYALLIFRAGSKPFVSRAAPSSPLRGEKL